MVRIIDKYGSAMIEASKSALIELMTILKGYSKSLVLVGGWVPYFLLQRYQRKDNPFRHVGSIDIDVAINPKEIDVDRYATIVELIEERGYKNRVNKFGQPILYSFDRKTPSPVDNKEYLITVDFLSSEPEMFMGRRKRRHRTVQPDLRARMMHGCRIALEHCVEYELSGILPKDGETTIRFKIADIVGALGTKGIAIGERYREKDAYDIYSLVANYKNGPKDVAEEVKPYLDGALVNEGIANIKDKFRDINAEGLS